MSFVHILLFKTLFTLDETLMLFLIFIFEKPGYNIFDFY